MSDQRWLTATEGFVLGAAAVACGDALSGSLCARVPLVLYSVAALVGAAAGWLLVRRLPSAVRVGGHVAAVLGAAAIAWTAMQPSHWQSHCGFSYCPRALGMGWLLSPFPVTPPRCEDWMMCVNEYPYSPGELADVRQRMARQGCPAP